MPAKIKFLCFSGWANGYRSLERSLVKFNNSEPLSFDYLNFLNFSQFFNSIKGLKYSPDIIVGWSLGGQIACRLISQKIFRPKLLVIISSPFQFVKSFNFDCGMLQTGYESFREAFKISPNETLKRFAGLILKNDSNLRYIKSNLDIYLSNHSNLEFWLDELGSFSCSEVDFNNFPRTVLIYGDRDFIVDAKQSKYFVEQIKNSRLEIFSNCGHCPQLHDAERFELILKEEKELAGL